MGLVSNGGIHSHQKHLEKLCDFFYSKGICEIFIHAFTDGRDSDPKSGLNFIKKLQKRVSPLNTKIASIIGRYYAMDRDKRWDRTKKAYDLLVKGKGEKFNCPIKAIESSCIIFYFYVIVKVHRIILPKEIYRLVVPPRIP